MKTAKEYYEEQRLLGNTESITGNPAPEYDEAFYQQIFGLMERFSEQFKYNYSQSCRCEESDRIGETWCCNTCGLPVDNESSAVKSDVRVNQLLEVIESQRQTADVLIKKYAELMGKYLAK